MKWNGTGSAKMSVVISLARPLVSQTQSRRTTQVFWGNKTRHLVLLSHFNRGDGRRPTSYHRVRSDGDVIKFVPNTRSARYGLLLATGHPLSFIYHCSLWICTLRPSGVWLFHLRREIMNPLEPLVPCQCWNSAVKGDTRNIWFRITESWYFCEARNGNIRGRLQPNLYREGTKEDEKEPHSFTLFQV